MTAKEDEIGVRQRADIAQIVEEFGGAASLVERMDEHERLATRMKSEIASLPELTGDRWVAMGLDEALEIGNSLSEVLARIEEKGLADGTVVVEFLSAEPEALIL